MRRILAVLMAGTALMAVRLPAASAVTDDDPGALCLRAQTQTAHLNQAALTAAGGTMSNVTYSDAASFEQSKPEVQPLTTGAYVSAYEDAAHTLPEQIRCKGKSSDRLQSVYGTNVAGPEGHCSDVNAETLREVAADLPAGATLKYQPSAVAIDPDLPSLTGADWLWNFPTAYRSWTGKLHIPSRSLWVPWGIPLLPSDFQGQHYCTLIAPSYLKRLLLGEASV